MVWLLEVEGGSGYSREIAQAHFSPPPLLCLNYLACYRDISRGLLSFNLCRANKNKSKTQKVMVLQMKITKCKYRMAMMANKLNALSVADVRAALLKVLLNPPLLLLLLICVVRMREL